jgi:hypothetical protein
MKTLRNGLTNAKQFGFTFTAAGDTPTLAVRHA